MEEFFLSPDLFSVSSQSLSSEAENINGIHQWYSPYFLLSALFFYIAEKKAKDPVIDLQFFTRRNFALGNFATFLSSFAIFSLFAYAPLFVQGALGKSPMQVGGAMLALSLGWSCGSLVLGRYIANGGGKPAAVTGSLLLLLSSLALLFFTIHTSMVTCWLVFTIAGLGMGFVTLSSLLLVQNSLSNTNLGVATSFHQFARTFRPPCLKGFCHDTCS